MMNFNNVYSENHKWVVNLINSRIRNRVEAEEMANDVFLKINENLTKFDADKCTTGLVGWIRSMVWNKIIDHYRKRKMDTVAIEDYVDDEGKEIYSFRDSTDIEAEYCTNEFVNNAHSVIAMLPEPYKSVATMFYVKDMSYEEIVQATDVKIGTVKGQLVRARKLMQTEFGIV